MLEWKRLLLYLYTYALFAPTFIFFGSYIASRSTKIRGQSDETS